MYTNCMFIKVKLLNGFTQSLWYKKPDSWQPASLVGTIVRVPLRTQLVPALVISEQNTQPDTSFAIKEACEIEPIPRDEYFNPFIDQLASYYQISSLHLIKRIRQFVHQKPVQDTAIVYEEQKPSNPIHLTQEQEAVVTFISPKITNNYFCPIALHGVTGSGKTEIYKALARQAIENNKTVVLLLPEVTLAIEFEKRLRSELVDIPICSFHSGTTTKQKRLLWQRMINEQATLIIGVHLPILLPIPNLGLIIIDEEHEIGYQEKKHPKINSKEAALLRANIHKIPIILGSATPSISTLYNVKIRGWHFFQLKQRFAGRLPNIKTVFLNDKKQRKNFWISQELYFAIKDRLSKKEQTIIFINRRGFSFFVQCKSCSYIFECPSCSVSLTLHANDMLSCHYCSFHLKLPSLCPKCNEKEFLKKGIGTQQVVSILEHMFPDAKIARADLDTTQRKKEWQKTMLEFHAGTIDILVGTQTITKGYHFPKVTLVGVLWADLNLHFPIFNAAETTLQQLIQVAGRAGRQSDESLVIVQTMADHTIFNYLDETLYLKFYHDELESRGKINYPPTKRLIEIELKHTNEMVIERESHDLAIALFHYAQRHFTTIQILGPAKPPVHKIKNIFSRKIYIKSDTMQNAIALYHAIDTNNYQSSIYFTPNPVT